jgi:hypothetical protein
MTALVTLELTTHPATITNAVPFDWPYINSIDPRWFIDPLDKIYIYDTDGTTAKGAWAVEGNTVTQHANPIQIDRYGNLPSIAVESGDLMLDLTNEYSVSKYTASRTSGVWALRGNIGTKNIGFTITTHAAFINLSTPINANAEALSLTTHSATISAAAPASGTALHSESNEAITTEGGNAIILEE